MWWHTAGGSRVGCHARAGFISSQDLRIGIRFESSSRIRSMWWTRTAVLRHSKSWAFEEPSDSCHRDSWGFEASRMGLPKPMRHEAA